MLPYTHNEHLLFQNIRFKATKKACKKKTQEINEFKPVHNLRAVDCLAILKPVKQRKKEFKSNLKDSNVNCTYVRNSNGVLKLIEGIVMPERLHKNKWILIKYAKI